MPAWIYASLSRWHHLSFLNTRETMDFLRRVERRALQPAAIRALIQVIEGNLGFRLYQAVERTKMDLSGAERSTFVFRDLDPPIEATVTRSMFEEWIAEEVAGIGRCVDRLMAGAGASGRDVQRVFMTGGSSFVPAVRRLFEDRFGADRIRGGGELTSVASGLALYARDIGLA